MERERRIEAPEGCEIEKVEIVDGAAVVTFREKERKLPKSWEEFCEMYPINAKECYITFYSEIISFDPETEISERNNVRDRSILPDRATADAVLALMQLIQLRNAYNGDWVPDYDDEEKYCIYFWRGDLKTYNSYQVFEILTFKTRELREEFMCNFSDLIDKLKPLYGIKTDNQQ